MLKLYKLQATWETSNPDELSYVELHTVAASEESAIQHIRKTFALGDCSKLSLKIVGVYDITEGIVF